MSNVAMFLRISGTFNFTSAPIEFPYANRNEAILDCDTSGAPVIINLAKIAKMGGDNFNTMIKIHDASNNATVNPITINSAVGETFNGGANKLTINENDGCILLFMLSKTTWGFIKLAPAINDKTSPSQVFCTENTLTPAQILTLDTVPVEIIPAVAGKIVHPLTYYMLLDFNSIPYVSGVANLNAFWGATFILPFTFLRPLWESAVDYYYSGNITTTQMPPSGAQAPLIGQAVTIKSDVPITLGNSPVRIICCWEAIG